MVYPRPKGNVGGCCTKDSASSSRRAVVSVGTGEHDVFQGACESREEIGPNPSACWFSLDDFLFVANLERSS